jgi:hypothetical protein
LSGNILLLFLRRNHAVLVGNMCNSSNIWYHYFIGTVHSRRNYICELDVDVEMYSEPVFFNALWNEFKEK